MSSPQAGSTTRLQCIDALRGLAVLLVVFSHLPFSWAALGSTGDPGGQPALPQFVTDVLEFGRFGVSLFIVISGFCIHLTWATSATRPGAGAKAPGFGSFWRRRLHRLYPPYLVALGGTLALTFCGHALLQGQRGSVGAMFGYASSSQFVVDLVLLLLLAHNLNGASWRIGNGPFWSLALEEQLYMLYFVLLWMRARISWSGILLVTFLCSLAWTLIGVLHAEQLPSGWSILGPARWFEWTLGACAVESYRGLLRLPSFCFSPWSFAAGLLCSIWLTAPAHGWEVPWVLSLFQESAWALTFFFLINVAYRREIDGAPPGILASSPLAFVGVISYSIYLVHNPLMIATKQVIVKMGVTSAAAIVLSRLAVALIGGWLFFHMVEKRFLNRRPSP